MAQSGGVFTICAKVIACPKRVASGEFAQRRLKRIDGVREAGAEHVAQRREWIDLESRQVGNPAEKRNGVRREAQRSGIERTFVLANGRRVKVGKAGAKIEHHSGRNSIDVVISRTIIVPE